MVAETFAPRAHRKLAGRLPGEDLEAYVERLATQLEERLAEIEGPRTDVALYDQRNRPIVTSAGIYGYNASGLSVVAPDIVQINTEDLVDLAVSEPKVADASIGTAKIQDLAVTSALLGTASVITAKIDDLAVNNAKIANMAVDKLTAGVIGASGIYVGSTVNATEIHIDGPNNRITVSDEATPTANPMVYLGKLPDTSYGIQILDDAGATVLKSSSTGSTFAASLDASKITVSNLDAGNITAGTLSVDRIGANSITAAKIAAGTLTTTEIAANTIAASNIAAGTITGTEISGTTLSGIFADLGTITAGNIDASQVTITNLNAGNISTGTLAAARIGVNTVDATKINVANLAAIESNLGTITAGTINGVTLNTVTLNADQATINNLNFTDISQGDLNVGTQLATDALTEVSIATATNTADLPVGEGSCLYTTIAATLGDEFLIEIMGTWNLNGTDYPSGGRASIAIGQSVSPHSSVGALFTSFNALRWESGEDGEKSFAMGYVWAPTATNTYRIHILGDAPGSTAVDSVFAVVKVTRLTPQG